MIVDVFTTLLPTSTVPVTSSYENARNREATQLVATCRVLFFVYMEAVRIGASGMISSCPDDCRVLCCSEKEQEHS